MNLTFIKSKGCLGAIAIAVLALLALLIFVGTLIGTFNSYSRKESEVTARQTDNTNVLDNQRKKIRDAAGVSQQEVDALIAIIKGNSEARGKNSAGSGALVTVGSVQEAVPSITSIETLKTLQNIVVSGRQSWQEAQTRLIASQQDANNMINTFPGNIVLPLMGKHPIKITVVTSSETEENFQTGKDDSSWVPAKPAPTAK